jgi:F-type H+-transporting ATPase subunit a
MKILIRYILMFLSFFAIVMPIEQSAMATEATVEISENMASVHQMDRSKIPVEHTKSHEGPHIPGPKGDIIEGWSIGWLHITNTIFSTWIFMGLLFTLTWVMYMAISTSSLPRVRAFGLDIVNRIYMYASSLVGDKEIAKKYMWLLGGLIVVIFLGNITGLMFDWLVLISKEEWLWDYLRPIYSDLSTTLVFSLTVILVAQLTAFYLKGPVHHLGHYLFNYHGDTIAEKIVGVFVGWLHFAWEFIRIGSLSMRLFLNIFVGAILIGVVVYVGEQIPSFHTGAFRILALPFWFFELLVAFLQAYIFMTLSSLYIRESLPDPHH